MFQQSIAAVALVFVSFKLLPLGFPSVFFLCFEAIVGASSRSHFFFVFSDWVSPLVCILYVLAESLLFLVR